MKKAKLTAIVLLFTCSGLLAQTMDEYKDFLSAGIKLTTKELIYKELELTPEEVANFDAIFDSYFDKRSAIARERLPVLVNYSLNAPMMNEEALREFNKYLMQSARRINKLNNKYYNKARKVIPIKKATALFLAEAYLRNSVENELIEGVFAF